MSHLVTMFVRNDLRNDTRVWKEAAVLRDAGWQVHLIGVQTPGTAREETHDGISVRRVNVQPVDSRLLKPWVGPSQPTFTVRPGVVGQRGKFQPVRQVKAALRRAWGPWHEELATRAFTTEALRVVETRHADVYHAHDLNALRPALQARRRWGGQVVFDAHEFYSERNFFRKPGPIEHAILRREEEQGCRAADRCITVSQSIAAELHRRYRLQRTPTVVMNCPDAQTLPNSIEPLSSRLGVEGKVLLYIGAVTWNRGIEQALEALQGLPEIHLACLGPVQAGYRSFLESRANELGLGARLHFLPPVAPGNVAVEAAGADAAIVLIQNACLSYYYCSPNKLFEALAAGLPVVASDFPDMRRVLAGSGAGVLCNPSDPVAIGSAVKQALALPRNTVREAAAKITNQYSWRNEGRKLVELYAELISHQRTEPV